MHPQRLRLHTFKEELTGPEYAARFIEQVEALGIAYKLNTMVLDLAANKTVTATNKTDGLFQLHPKRSFWQWAAGSGARRAEHPRLPPGGYLYRRHGPAACQHGGLPARAAGGHSRLGDIG